MVEDAPALSKPEWLHDKTFPTGTLGFGVETILGGLDEEGVQALHDEDDEEHEALASCLDVDVVSFNLGLVGNASIGRRFWVFWRIRAK